MNRYLIGGLVLESEIDFPEMIKTDRVDVDVVVQYGKVPEALENESFKKVLFTMNESDEVLFKMPEIANYLIKGNSLVTIDLLDEERKEDAHKYLLTFVLGVLSFKSGFFPLHGGGIVHKGEAYLFTGTSGAGKSTTMAGLQQRGFATVGDDIANLFVEDNVIKVHPCFPRFKLWEESLTILNNKNEGEYKLRKDLNKYLVPVNNFHAEMIPVKRIYLLQETADVKESFIPVKGQEKISKIKANSYKPWMVKSFGLEKKHFGLMMKMASKVEFVEFHRTKKKEDLDEMFKELIAHIKGE